MKKKLFNVFLFATGAAIGSLVTWKFVKTKYERILQEEIDSVKETWARQMGTGLNRGVVRQNESELNDSDDELDDGYGTLVMTDYAALAGKYGNPSGEATENDEKGDGGEEVPYINGPCVITPDEYGDGNFDHSLYCLTYYSDDVLANDWWETLDIEETIGRDALEHFGDYAEDIVHVRNERLNADYEVVRDHRTYAEVTANDPLMRAYES